MPNPKQTIEKINNKVVEEIGTCYNCKDSKSVDSIQHPLIRFCKNTDLLCPDDYIPLWCPIRKI